MEPRHGIDGGFCQIHRLATSLKMEKYMKEEEEEEEKRTKLRKENGRKVRPKLSINRYRHSKFLGKG
jgi:hypothetical protein